MVRQGDEGKEVTFLDQYNEVPKVLRIVVLCITQHPQRQLS